MANGKWETVMALKRHSEGRFLIMAVSRSKPVRSVSLVLKASLLLRLQSANDRLLPPIWEETIFPVSPAQTLCFPENPFHIFGFLARILIFCS
jgi:hypothetical protein